MEVSNATSLSAASATDLTDTARCTLTLVGKIPVVCNPQFAHIVLCFVRKGWMCYPLGKYYVLYCWSQQCTELLE